MYVYVLLLLSGAVEEWLQTMYIRQVIKTR